MSPVSCPDDYRPITLTKIVIKCFERLVMKHMRSILPPTLYPHQFAYRSKRSTEDAVSSALHLALTILENKDAYIRMLFMDISSAFNTTTADWEIEHNGLQHAPPQVDPRLSHRKNVHCRWPGPPTPPANIHSHYEYSCITTWYGNSTMLDRKSLQKVVRTAERIIGVSLPATLQLTPPTQCGEESFTETCMRKDSSVLMLLWKSNSNGACVQNFVAKMPYWKKDC